MKQLFLSAFSLIIFTTSIFAQNTTNLPTSMYGIGELSASDGGHYAGMGNIGIALNRLGFQNTQNPAAITHMDTACFNFDVGMTISYARYSFLGNHSSNSMGNPNRINIGFRLFPHWYGMIGLAPYSSVGYIIQSEDEVEGTNGGALYSLFEGTGGLYRFYVTNAIALSKNLSIGANIGFVSGTINQEETQESSVIKYESKKKALYSDLGIYYNLNSSSKQHWSVGLVYAFPNIMHQTNNLTYSSSSTDEDLDVSFHKTKQYLPERIGAGAALTTERWVLTADYNWLNWSRNSSSSTLVEYQNQHKINVGGIYILHPRNSRSAELMGGIGFNNSYITLKNGKMTNLEISTGISFPIRYSYLSLGATWRKQMNNHKNLMQENRISINLSLTFGEKISRFKLK
ncbi:MAG: hypothetical protein LKI29_09910 [Bacteroides sp.]|jgi:hypothetical protein|nr:hypothetical protein [Bacteroides sp.]